ncbi:MAG: hypothetical protein WA005_09320 [Candidatus Binataceae bacterium]
MNGPRPLAALALIVLAGSIAGGCSLFHRNRQTPQQKFVDALNQGNSAEASQIWFQMSPDDRNKLRRGYGITPAVSPDQAMKLLNQAQANQSERPITIAPDLGASLMRLPALATPPAAAAASPDSPAPSP